MDKIWYSIIIIGTGISIIVGYLTLSEYVIRFSRWILKKEDKRKKICIKIIEWFNFIDSTLTENGVDLEQLDIIEKEIDFLFRIENNSKIMLNFSRRFINKYLSFCGINHKYFSRETFIKYAHINHINLDLILGLESDIQKKTITPFYMPFKTYWGIFRGNFHIFHLQFINNWHDTPQNEKVTFSDIEMPIKLLRMYYKIY